MQNFSAIALSNSLIGNEEEVRNRSECNDSAIIAGTLRPYKRLAARSYSIVIPGGVLMLELGIVASEAVSVSRRVGRGLREEVVELFLRRADRFRAHAAPGSHGSDPRGRMRNGCYRRAGHGAWPGRALCRRRTDGAGRCPGPRGAVGGADAAMSSACNSIGSRRRSTRSSCQRCWSTSSIRPHAGEARARRASWRPCYGQFAQRFALACGQGAGHGPLRSRRPGRIRSHASALVHAGELSLACSARPGSTSSTWSRLRRSRPAFSPCRA